MRKFKHKKTGKIAANSNNPNFYYFFSSNNPLNVIHKYFIEDSNDWEEVIEKEYYILSFKNGDSIVINSEETYDIYEYINSPNWVINSVKRLSDEEIFTIGDKIRTSHGYEFIIESFKLNINIFLYGNKYYEHLKFATKVLKKEHLFTTQDGYKIFEKQDEWEVGWEVNLSTFELKSVNFKPLNYNILKGSYKYFKNRNNAIEYIMENQPCLSLKECLKYGIHNDLTYDKIYDKILEVVKTRLGYIG